MGCWICFSPKSLIRIASPRKLSAFVCSLWWYWDQAHCIILRSESRVSLWGALFVIFWLTASNPVLSSHFDTAVWLSFFALKIVLECEWVCFLFTEFLLFFFSIRERHRVVWLSIVEYCLQSFLVCWRLWSLTLQQWISSWGHMVVLFYLFVGIDQSN